MKNKVLLPLLLGIIIVGAQNTFAQTPNNIVKSDSNKVVLSKWAISGGIGLACGYDVPGCPSIYNPAATGDDQWYIYSPEFNCSIHYRFSSWFSLDAALGYESGILMVDNEPFDSVSKLSLGIRTLFYLNKKQKYFEHYLGIRGAISLWHDIKINPIPNGGWPPVIGASYLHTYSFQVFYGFSLYPGGGCFGFNFEIGIGPPYIGEGGITFRF